MSLGSKTVPSPSPPTANHLPAPKKFEDRAALALSWFEGWSEAKRWRFLERLLSLCSEKHLRRVHHVLEPKVPKARADFTRLLPHNLCLHILGLLDPRTLCRASQVCWYWKLLCEDNSLWRVKCLRYGWALPQPPADHELGVWKRHYVMCVHNLHWVPPKSFTLSYHGGITKDKEAVDPPLADDTDTETTVSSVFPPAEKEEEFIHHDNSEGVAGRSRPPWRVTDRKPNELVKSTILWTSQPQKRQQNRPPPRLSQSRSVNLTAQRDESTVVRAEMALRQSTSTPFVGGVRGRGGSEQKLHSHSVEDVKPHESSVAEEVQPKYQSSIEAWLSVRESQGSGAAWSRSQPTLRKTVPALSQGRSDGGELSNKTPPSHDSWSAGSAARPPAHRTSVVQSAWQLTRPHRDKQSEPNKTAILLKPWQPSHASHVMVHDSDVSDDESI